MPARAACRPDRSSDGTRPSSRSPRPADCAPCCLDGERLTARIEELIERGGQSTPALRMVLHERERGAGDDLGHGGSLSAARSDGGGSRPSTGPSSRGRRSGGRQTPCRRRRPAGGRRAGPAPASPRGPAGSTAGSGAQPRRAPRASRHSEASRISSARSWSRSSWRCSRPAGTSVVRRLEEPAQLARADVDDRRCPRGRGTPGPCGRSRRAAPARRPGPRRSPGRREQLAGEGPADLDALQGGRGGEGHTDGERITAVVVQRGGNARHPRRGGDEAGLDGLLDDDGQRLAPL